MKTIELTQGRVTFVDDCDYERVMAAGPWRACRNRSTFYAQRHGWVDGHRKTQKLHRFILGITDPKVKVDHENRNGLDCRRHNLRVATDSQNMVNRKMQKNNSSGLKGVTWHKHDQIWRSQIQVNGMKKCLGTFDDRIAAARRYDKAAIEAFGEFALTNEKLGLLPAMAV